MPTVEETASAAVALLDRRASEAQTQQREADRVAAEKTQRESAAADVARLTKLHEDWRQLAERERALHSNLESRRLPGTSVFVGPPNEIAELRRSHARVLQERAIMLRRYPFLESENL